MMPITQEACSKMRQTTLLLLILIQASAIYPIIVVIFILNADGITITSALERITMEA